MATTSPPPSPFPGTPAAMQAAIDAYHAEAAVWSDDLRRTFRHHRGLAYGPHPSQVVDLYLPNGTPTGDVLAFVHGGGFQQGEPGLVAYVGRAFLESGGIFAALGYRLAPEVVFPDTVADVEAGLAWLAQHVGEYGGDPRRLLLAGHSAGAMLAAQAGLHNAWTAEHGLPPDTVQGLLLFGGAYTAEHTPPGMARRESPRFVPDLLADIRHVPPRGTVVVAGSRETMPSVLEDSPLLVAAIKARGGHAEYHLLEGVDHYHTVDSLAEPDGAIFAAARRLLTAAPPSA